MSTMREAASYRSSNKVMWSRYPALMLGSLLVGLLVALLVALVRSWGFYLIFVAPFIAAILSCALMQQVVAFAKCRNGFMAAKAGFLGGLCAYLGGIYFYFAIQAQMLPNPIFIPRMMQFMINNNVIVEKGRNDAGKQPNTIENSLFMLMDISIMSIAPAVLAWQQSRKVYCEKCNAWAKHETCFVPAGAGVALNNSLNEGTLDSFVPTVVLQADPQHSATVLIEYCSAGQSPIDCPIYLTVTDAAAGKQAKSMPRQSKLEPDEIMDMLPWYPKLAETLNKKHGIVIQNTALDELSAEGSQRRSARYATSQAVNQKPQDKLINGWYKLAINLIPGVPFLSAFAFGGIALFFASREYITLAVIFGILFGIFLIVSAYMLMLGMSVVESKWTVRKFGQLIRRREDALGWFDDPSKRLVALLNPGGLQATSFPFSDILWLKFDDASRSIRMLGDNDNYVIPYESISSVEPHANVIHGGVQIWSVGLSVEFEEARRPFLLLLANPKFGIYTNSRRYRNAEAFATEIKQFCQRHQPVPVALTSTLGM